MDALRELLRLGSTAFLVAVGVVIGRWSLVVEWRAETWSAVFEGLTLAVLIVAGILAYLQYKHVHQAGHSQYLTRLGERWDSDQMRHARWLVNRHAANLEQALIDYDSYNRPEYYDILSVANFFEDVGFLISQGYFSREEVKKVIDAPARYYFDLFRPWIRTKQEKQKKLYEHFEKLATT